LLEAINLEEYLSKINMKKFENTGRYSYFQKDEI